MKPKEKIKLVWSNFQTNIVDSFKISRLTQEFSDVTLACDGTNNTIEAHRIILSSGSSFFREILSKQTSQHPHPLLYLEELGGQIWRPFWISSTTDKQKCLKWSSSHFLKLPRSSESQDLKVIRNLFLKKRNIL